MEAAVALPLLIALLFAILVYGNWFMTAHSLQQAANNAARVAVAGLNAAERRTLVDQSVAASRSTFPSPGTTGIAIAVSESGGYYTVALSCDLSAMPIFAASPFPLPSTTLRRSAVIQIGQS
ncbi:MAG: TadE/TadG family type IV pilus assembly protein [Sphingobium sp.]